MLLAVLSQKGGVGKTTVALGLVGSAQRAGLRTLVIDLDPQANATLWLAPREIPLSASDVLADGRPGIAADAIVRTGWGSEIDVIAADAALSHRNSVGTVDDAYRLRRSLDTVTHDYDLVVLDCPPSMGELTRNGLVAAQSALIVTEAGYFALRGAQQAVESAQIVSSALNPDLVTAGIVVNRLRGRSKEQDFRLKELREVYPKLLLEPPIPERAAVQRAQGAGVPIHRAGQGGRQVAERFDAVLTQTMRRSRDREADQSVASGVG